MKYCQRNTNKKKIIFFLSGESSMRLGREPDRWISQREENVCYIILITDL